MDRHGRNAAVSPLRMRADLHRSTATSVLTHHGRASRCRDEICPSMNQRQPQRPGLCSPQADPATDRRKPCFCQVGAASSRAPRRFRLRARTVMAARCAKAMNTVAPGKASVIPPTWTRGRRPVSLSCPGEEPGVVRWRLPRVSRTNGWCRRPWQVPRVLSSYAPRSSQRHAA